MSPLWRLVAAIVVVIVCAGALALAVIALPLATYERVSTNDSATTTVDITTRNTDLAQEGQLALAWARQYRIRLGDRSGLVTSTRLATAQPLSCGDVVLTIDDVDIFAFCGSRPLYRAIDGSSVGTDAEDVAKFLQQQLDATIGPNELSMSIRRFQLMHGRPATSVLDPSEFVWIGENGVVPIVISLDVGSYVESRAEVAVVGGTLESAVATVPGGLADSGDELVFTPTGSLQIFDLDPAGRVSDLEGLAGVLRTLGIASDSSTVAPTTLPGTLRLAEPRDLFAVPASSIVGSNGSECIAVRRDGEDRTVAVTIVSSAVGVVFVMGDLAVGMRVVTDPARTGTC